MAKKDKTPTVFESCGSAKGCEIEGGTGRYRVGSYPDFRYTTQAAPCATARTGCPVQLIFDQGQPKLRFCKGVKKPGFVVRVDSPEQASRLAKQACACWKANRKQFSKCFPKGTALGGLRRR